MARYRYKACGKDGSVQTGITEAADDQALLEQLHRRGLFCCAYHKETAKSRGAVSRKLRLKVLPPFCRQMAAMLTAGIPVSRALAICGEASRDRVLKNVLIRLNVTVQKGKTLSEAMNEMPGTFPDLLIHMVETGESSGSLDQIMEKMAKHYSQEAELGGKVQNAMTYPVILLIVTLVSTAFMLTAVLPRFASMLSSTELPAITRFMINLSSLLKNHGILILLIGAGLLLLGLFLMERPSARLCVDAYLLRIPVAGRLMKTVYTSRFAATFAVLYGSGTSILTCLDVTSRVMENTYIRECLKETAGDLRKGELLSQSLGRKNIFLPMFISMVVAGEESGSLESVLRDTGEFYEKEALRALEQMITLVEPCMMILMALVVGSIVMAIMLPVYTMYSQML